MKQAQFVARHQANWEALSQWLHTPANKREGRHAERFATLYRQLCHHLALARRRGYSPQLLAHLEQLMQLGHAELYRSAPVPWYRLPLFLLVQFPRTVRAHSGAMLVASVLFWGPLLLSLLLLQWRPELSDVLLDSTTLAQMEKMYDPSAERLGRDSGSDWQMFGFYIYNNISIGLRTFASGLLLGIGALVILLFNGIHIGSAAGHLTAIGSGAPFWEFVSSHAPWELTAIVLAGGAGLQLGMRVLAPGQLSRGQALASAGRDGAVIILGVVVMLLLAAFIEAFWSAQTIIPAVAKYIASALGWLLVTAWLLLGGRGDGHAH
ncbi:membrane protein [Stenotrophomonas ginsengisoli]|uniref:Membrane protein n=1 Tax=Stenotrophomonas ginsengisoli TaxID=336566 RepID=A0A0R0D9W2_9GAMM|nr:stage II sporulation protein M [Stenotrophomonas ginsengisoli]KRG74179.1 membrane protein [Stenotrophomonas ginsengisoli]